MLDAGIKPGHIMVYMLCGYWKTETFDDVYYRFEKMRDMGLMPYPMIYIDSPDFKRLKKFQRWVIRRYYQFIDWETFNTTSEKDYYEAKNPKIQQQLF